MSLELNDTSAIYLEFDPFSPFLHASENCATVSADVQILVEPGTFNILGASYAFAEPLLDQSDNPLLTEDSP